MFDNTATVVLNTVAETGFGEVNADSIGYSIYLEISSLLMLIELQSWHFDAGRHSRESGFTRCSRPPRTLTSSWFPPDVTKRAKRKLEYIDLAACLEDLKVPPGNRLHKLDGDCEGQHSISINKQWRICFVFDDGDAFDVEVCDYH